jgi:hypothetical protein
MPTTCRQLEHATSLQSGQGRWNHRPAAAGLVLLCQRQLALLSLHDDTCSRGKATQTSQGSESAHSRTGLQEIKGESSRKPARDQASCCFRLVLQTGVFLGCARCAALTGELEIGVRVVCSANLPQRESCPLKISPRSARALHLAPVTSFDAGHYYQ